MDIVRVSGDFRWFDHRESFIDEETRFSIEILIQIYHSEGDCQWENYPVHRTLPHMRKPKTILLFVIHRRRDHHPTSRSRMSSMYVTSLSGKNLPRNDFQRTSFFMLLLSMQFRVGMSTVLRQSASRTDPVDVWSSITWRDEVFRMKMKWNPWMKD